MSEELPSLEALENLIRKRRAIRHFAPTDIDHALVERLLESARWAPSGYNLQPTRFVVVTDRAIRPALQRACLNQAQVSEAPVVVVFAADHRAYEDHFEKIIELDLAAGAVDEKYVNLLRRVVPIMLRRGPLGLNWIWKRLLVPVVRFAAPLPLVPAVEKRFWLGKQAMLCAMNFMLAAEAAGLNTVPMEGFDTGRLRRCLELPASWEPMLVVPVGYRKTDGAIKTRRPLVDVSLWR